MTKDSILYCDTCFTAQALVKLYLDLFEKNEVGEVRIEDVVSTIEVLARDLSVCKQLLSVNPVHRRQQDSYDKVLRIITHLLHLVTRLPASEDIQLAIRRRIHVIVHQVQPRTTAGDTGQTVSDCTCSMAVVIQRRGKWCIHSCSGGD